ncbi:MAG TPA: lipid-A-disaccharide synthase [Cyclobacteriaceae bacterium]|jgi:lipid-A-disaccharide synthase|nr:lipid-A-disaccharide synthase [Cyclobacteriaceae bacterium]
MRKIYIVAGERSGDLHGSNLTKALLARDSSLSLRGFGGDEMKKAGVDIFVHYEQLAFMGFVALVTNLFTIFKFISLCKKDIDQFKPEAIILIDYGGFNRRIAKFAKEKGIKVFYYIPPKVWAWYQSRAFELKQNVDRLFVILPFEKKFFKDKCNWDVDYVGNPVLDAIKAFKPDPDFLTKNGLDRSKKIIALLPGSRKMELKRIVPLMAEIIKTNPLCEFVVAAVNNLNEELYTRFKNLPNVKFVFDASYDLLTVADAAIVTSGTATLETCIFKVPQVVVYKTGGLEYAIASRVVKVAFISLVNLIAGKEVVKELIQEKAIPTLLNAELSKLIRNEEYRAEIKENYEGIFRALDTGSASENAAFLMVKYLVE